MTQNRSSAVMQQRHEALDSLDDFPTPPWATRALFECVFPAMGIDLSAATVWEPACNRGLMAAVIAEYAADVYASDVHAYGYGHAVGSFVGGGGLCLDVAAAPWGGDVDAVITNPPFRLAAEFVERALIEAPVVAILQRSAWAEGGERYERIFRDRPPSRIAYFVERVAMVQGGWQPDASSATSYAWFVWARDTPPLPPFWIPPGRRKALTRPGDVAMADRLGVLKREEAP